MKQITTNNRTLLFVEVPEDASEITLTELGRLDYMTNGGMDYTMLPTGNYRLIATTDMITEKQAAMFVEKKHDNPLYFKNYYVENGSCMYATVSFETLLQHHSITGRHAIIEVI